MLVPKSPRSTSVLSTAALAVLLIASCSNSDNSATTPIASGYGGVPAAVGGVPAMTTTTPIVGSFGGAGLVTASGGAPLGTSLTTQGGSSARGGTSASVGGTVGQGGASTAASTVWRGPTAPTATAKFPFPQNRQSANCIYPTNYRNEDVQAIYAKWKTDVVVADGGNFRIRRPQEPGLEPNSTVSEGIAYGMIIAVYMNDQPLFDGLWKYWLSHTWTCVPTQCGSNTPTLLMNWYILADGNPGSMDGKVSLGAATDADEDAAWALIMADKQWGGTGSLSKSYLQSAKDLLSDIWKYEIYEGQLPRNGSSWGDWKDLNVSYFAPSEYRAFFGVDPGHPWITDVVRTSYDTLEKSLTDARGNKTNGLVPAWTNSNGTDIVSTDNRPKHYQYDSCRTPFRIGLDACFNNEQRAVSYVSKTSNFFSGVGASKIVTGYDLNGNPRPEFPSGQSSSFVGTAGVGAMHSATYQSFVNDVYALVRQNNMNVGGLYYDESWAMMTILMMTGNYLDYTKY